MVANVQDILDAFDHLPTEQQIAAATMILRRTISLPVNELGDDELSRIADDLFASLDAESNASTLR